jgi:predicted PhzF superfamily epimerase YddE/YHI9
VNVEIVDAFVEEGLDGNPAGVAVLDAFPDDATMQRVAAEVGLSETAFCVPVADAEEPTWHLRWFTPTVEMDLCGHATLATAYLLGGDPVFHTRSGELRCFGLEDDMVAMDFPADPPERVEVPAGLKEALGVRIIVNTFRARVGLLVELMSGEAVRALTPDIAALAAFDDHLVTVTAIGDRGGLDCVNRVFAPNVGIDEDPVTGSAHCMLAVFWADRLQRPRSKSEQASARGGFVTMELSEDRERVLLSGKCRRDRSLTL